MLLQKLCFTVTVELKVLIMLISPGCFQTVTPLVSHDVIKEKLYTKLAGCPIDFKDTYLHSRFDGRSNGPSAVVSCPEHEEIDAWRAADVTWESIKCEKAHQIELEKLHNERKLERGHAAVAKLLNDQVSTLQPEIILSINSNFKKHSWHRCCMVVGCNNQKERIRVSCCRRSLVLNVISLLSSFRYHYYLFLCEFSYIALLRYKRLKCY